jgi:hypothetical protein
MFVRFTNLELSAVETDLNFLYVPDLTAEDCLHANGRLRKRM